MLVGKMNSDISGWINGQNGSLPFQKWLLPCKEEKKGMGVGREKTSGGCLAFVPKKYYPSIFSIYFIFDS